MQILPPESEKSLPKILHLVKQLLECFYQKASRCRLNEMGFKEVELSFYQLSISTS